MSFGVYIMKGYNFQLKKSFPFEYKKAIEDNFSNFIVISLSKEKQNTYVYKQDHPLTIVQKEDISFHLVQ